MAHIGKCRPFGRNDFLALPSVEQFTSSRPARGVSSFVQEVPQLCIWNVRLGSPEGLATRALQALRSTEYT